MRRTLVLALVISFLAVSVSHANMKKGKIGVDGKKTFEFTTDIDGLTTISLIFDHAGTDLDLAIGLTDGTLIATSISGEDFFEMLQLGLIGERHYLLAINNFEGDATSFRVVVGSGQQQGISTASANGSLREIPIDANGKRLLEQLRKVESGKK